MAMPNKVTEFSSDGKNIVRKSGNHENRTFKIGKKLAPYLNNKLSFKCQELTSVAACRSIVDHFKHLYADLEAGNYPMHHCQPRRSPCMNIVGSVANSFFDIMDPTYADVWPTYGQNNSKSLRVTKRSSYS